MSQRASNQAKARRNREILREAKTGPCTDCGSRYPWHVMDLDHCRGEKSFPLEGGITRHKTVKALKAEIAKCDLVCPMCHRIRTMSRHINLNFTQEEIDLKLMARAKEVSLKSKDPSTQVGAVLAKSGVEISSGYNGFPHGVDDSPERYADRYIKYPMVVHAEVNAILQAGHAAEGCDLYVYPSFDLPPICADCAGVAIQAGIVCIIGYIPNPGDERAARWADSVSISKTMWEEAGLQIRSYQEV